MGYFERLVSGLHSCLRNPKLARAEKVHRTRVAIKRLKAVGRLSRHPSAAETRLLARLGRFSQSLAGDRDQYVMRETAAKLRLPFPESRVLVSSAGFPSGRAEFLVDKVARTLAANSWKKKNIRSGLRRSRRKVLQARKVCGAPRASAAQFHEWRKQIKNLVYQMEFAAAQGEKPRRGRRARLTSTAEILGKAHDHELLSAAVSRHPGLAKTWMKRVTAIRDRLNREAWSSDR